MIVQFDVRPVFSTMDVHNVHNVWFRAYIA